MTTKRRIRRWETAVRQQAQEHARALAVAIVAGTAWQPPPYDLGIILERGEVLWHRCPASYRWRGIEAWTVQQVSRHGRTAVAQEFHAPCLVETGMSDWLITNLRLASRTPDGQVVSIYWSGLQAVSISLDAGLVVFDGPDGYHGELSGPAIAPIAVAAIAACHGPQALLDHPALASLRVSARAPKRGRSRRGSRPELTGSARLALR